MERETLKKIRLHCEVKRSRDFFENETRGS